VVCSMRVLQLHCSEFSYQIRKETPVAEQPPEPREDHLENVLVCLICFEKKDEPRVEELIEGFIENLKVDTSRLRCSRVLLYPYAHLSKSLGSARLAKGFLKRLGERLVEEGIEVHKSPFGWYKAFSLNCIGHPLAEAYREF
jgi:threonyl-tRNA synthetase